RDSRTRAAEADAEAGQLDPGAERERDLLEAIYGEEFEVLAPNEWRVDIPGADGAALRLLLPAGYPRTEPPVPIFDFEGRRASEADRSGHHPGATGAMGTSRRRGLHLPVGGSAPGGSGAHGRSGEAPAEPARRSLRGGLGCRGRHGGAIGREGLHLPAGQSTVWAEAPELRCLQFRRAERRGDPAGRALHGDRKSTFQAFAAKVSNQGQVNWA
ncbi:unnamed protein product, partial [Effrenium voratum]